MALDLIEYKDSENIISIDLSKLYSNLPGAYNKTGFKQI